jgi:hypothetical protein
VKPRRALPASLRAGGSSDRWFLVGLLIFGGFLLSFAVLDKGDGETRLALAALGFALFFGASSLLTSLRRDDRASEGATRVESKLDELIELERQHLDELRAIRERGDESIPPD